MAVHPLRSKCWLYVYQEYIENRQLLYVMENGNQGDTWTTVYVGLPAADDHDFQLAFVLECSALTEEYTANIRAVKVFGSPCDKLGK